MSSQKFNVPIACTSWLLPLGRENRHHRENTLLSCLLYAWWKDVPKLKQDKEGDPLWKSPALVQPFSVELVKCLKINPNSFLILFLGYFQSILPWICLNLSQEREESCHNWKCLWKQLSLRKQKGIAKDFLRKFHSWIRLCICFFQNNIFFIALFSYNWR